MFAMYQSKNGNGEIVLHVTKTVDPAYTKGCLIANTIEEAEEKIKEWLRRPNAR